MVVWWVAPKRVLLREKNKGGGKGGDTTKECKVRLGRRQLSLWSNKTRGKNFRKRYRKVNWSTRHFFIPTHSGSTCCSHSHIQVLSKPAPIDGEAKRSEARWRKERKKGKRTCSLGDCDPIPSSHYPFIPSFIILKIKRKNKSINQ